MHVSVVDYGIGNIQSVVNACQRAGSEPSIVRDSDELLAHAAKCIIMPGVGAVGAALASLRERGLEDALNTQVQQLGIPFLGICVGMQVLAETCEEFGEHRGLGWIPGSVRQLPRVPEELKLPHMGWNTIETCTPDDTLLRDVDGKNVYFAHSYMMDCPDQFVLARTQYGNSRFTSAVRCKHIAGVQFHPEKSAFQGNAILRAFLFG